MGFPGGSVVKNLPVNVGDIGSVPGLERFPEEGNGNSLQEYLPRKPNEQRNLVGYNSWGHKRVGHNSATKTTRTCTS